MAEYISREAAMLQINAADFVRDDNFEGGATLLFCDDVVDRLSAIPAADVRPMEWIPVTERLPKEQETVLAFGTLGVAWLDWRHDNKWCCYDGVTHWMPLPEPPKEEQT